MTLALDRRAPKPPPENPEAEASLLGAILLDAPVYETVVRGRIAPPDLSRDAHRLVLGAIERVAARGDTLGFQAVQAELAARDELEAAGGAQILVGLMQHVPTVAHAETYATIVERTALLRRLIAAANEITRLALTRDDAASAVEEAQALLFAVSESSLHRDIVTLDEALRRLAEQISARGDEAQTGIPTGLATLDAKTGGLQPSDLIIVAGRPGLGKTSLALSFLEHAAVRSGKTCAVFSLEMSELQLVQRLISMSAEIDGTRMRRGRLSMDELSAISQASSRLQQAPIFVEESSRLTVTHILAKSRRLQAERGCDLVIIDYLQLIEGTEDDENRVQEISRITRALKAIARELEVPVVALSQLSRQIETRGTEPMLSDLRECVTGDARVVDADTGLWREVQSLTPGMSLLALDVDQKLGPSRLADVWSTGRKPVFRLTSQTGREIKATANHPFLTPSGWRSLGELRPGDVIATARRLPDHGVERPGRAERCRLLGYMVGDGTYRRYGALGFISSDHEAFWDARSIIEGEWPEVTHRFKKQGANYLEADFVRLYANGYGKPHGNPFREWLAGYVGAANFLVGYLSADGSVKKSRHGETRARWAVQFDTVSHGLATDVQALLLRLGIVATIQPGTFNTKSIVPSYRIALSEAAANLEQFVQTVPGVGAKARSLILLWAQLPQGETNPGVFALPRELSRHLASLGVRWTDQGKRMRRSTANHYAELTRDPTLRRFAGSDLLWEKIRGIEPAGEEEVFDLRLPASGNFLANGFVVHNSGSIEEDSDLVMFLWQKDQQDRKDGLVRLKLAKHRNGPTADIDLHFEPELTRFRDLGESRTEAGG